MHWVALYDDETTAAAGPGQPIDRDHLVAVECEGYRVQVWPDAVFQHFERVSTGGTEWRVGIIAVDEHIYVVWPGGHPVHHQIGWGTDVLTGAPRAD